MVFGVYPYVFHLQNPRTTRPLRSACNSQDIWHLITLVFFETIQSFTDFFIGVYFGKIQLSYKVHFDAIFRIPYL